MEQEEGLVPLLLGYWLELRSVVLLRHLATEKKNAGSRWRGVWVLEQNPEEVVRN